MNVCTKGFVFFLFITASQYLLAGVSAKDFRQMEFSDAIKQIEYMLSWHSSNRNWDSYELRYIGVGNGSENNCSSGQYQSATITRAHEFVPVANGFPLGEVRLEIIGSDSNGKSQDWLILLNREIESLPVNAVTYQDYSGYSYDVASDRMINNFLGWYENNRDVDKYTLSYIDPQSGASQALTGVINTDFRSPLDKLGEGAYEFRLDVLFDDGTVSTRFISLNKLPGDVQVVSVDLMLSWNQPAYREDGTAINAKDIAGYEVYMTRVDANNNTTDQVLAVSNASQTNLTVPALSAGQYYLAISAIDTAGLKSQLSQVVSYTVN